jgi:tRNA1(Val) A37 N6-methylase TrmN6
VLDVINKDTDILDIGCNAGFISLTAAKKAKSVLGLESEPELTNIANGAKSIVNHGHEETDEKQKMDRKFYLLKRKRKPNGM